MMTDLQTTAPPVEANGSTRDIGFAIVIVFILTVLFLPLPAPLIDVALAFSIALSVLILMVALWIEKPLDFSAFPTVLLIATMLRLSLNIATTRLILSHGHEGYTAAGNVIAGFSKFVMSGDFVIGLIVFAILIIVNFLVITKGATRIAEVGARFTLDAIPGKQMAIDADLSAGLIDDKTAQTRRHELEEESAFFGAMDGASKFVRGDAVAGLIITTVNILGGIVIGAARHDLPLAEAADVFAKLSVGDGLVSQIPALIVSLAAGLLVSKGGTRGSVDIAVLGQLGRYPRALFVSAILMVVLALMPGLPFSPFLVIGGVLGFLAYVIPKREKEAHETAAAQAREREVESVEEARQSVKEHLKIAEIELCLGRQLSSAFLPTHEELAQRVAKMRRKFARQYGFVIPEIRLTDDLSLEPKTYQIKIHGAVVASEKLRLGDVLVIAEDERLPDVPGDKTNEPAFGLPAIWVSELLADEVRREGFTPIDNPSVLLTHLSEVTRNNLSQLLSYKGMRALLDRLEPEYDRLIEEIIPTHISFSGFQGVLKLLLAERVSIGNLHLILEAIAEIAPHVRRAEQIAEHVRTRMAQQICGNLAHDGVLEVIHLGSRWDRTFNESLKRDVNGETVKFDIDPKLIEEFSANATKVITKHLNQRRHFALVTSPDARPFVRMIIERLFTALPVLSHMEIARGVQIETLGSIS